MDLNKNFTYQDDVTAGMTRGRCFCVCVCLVFTEKRHSDLLDALHAVQY